MSASPSRNCSYAPLACYNASGDIKVPVPVTATQGFYVVPDYQTYGYQTLTGARSGAGPSCSGYFTLDHAYGSCNSMAYVRRSCM
jgi:hypothetical protein